MKCSLKPWSIRILKLERTDIEGEDLQLESAPKCAKSIQYVVLKNIQPWMSWSAASVLGSLSHNSPASRPRAIVCSQFRRDSIRGRASWKFRSDSTWNHRSQFHVKKMFPGASDVVIFCCAERIFICEYLYLDQNAQETQHSKNIYYDMEWMKQIFIYLGFSSSLISLYIRENIKKTVHVSRNFWSKRVTEIT